MKFAEAKVVLDERRAKNNGLYPVKLRITYDRKQKYYPTPHSLSKMEFEKIKNGERLKIEEKALKNKVFDFEKKASDIISDMLFFDWDEFDKKYIENRGAKEFIKVAYEQRIEELTLNEQIGTASQYTSAIKSLENFLPNSKFTSFTPQILQNYERFMIDKGRSKSTISMYLRSLRCIYNNAIANNYILPNLYPFRKNIHERDKYEIPESKNIKKSLNKAELEKIFNYKCKPNSIREKARDYWVFIYLTNGLNVKDLMLLKYGNITDNTTQFIREKTKRQKKEKTITAIIHPISKSIIDKWGNKNKESEQYVFNELTGKESSKRQFKLKQQLTHVINDNMKEIAKELGIKSTITTMVARHSFATMLKRSGKNQALIGEMMGHSSAKTTQNYFASFENEAIEDASNALTDFK